MMGNIRQDAFKRYKGAMEELATLEGKSVDPRAFHLKHHIDFRLMKCLKQIGYIDFITEQGKGTQLITKVTYHNVSPAMVGRLHDQIEICRKNPMYKRPNRVSKSGEPVQTKMVYKGPPRKRKPATKKRSWWSILLPWNWGA